MPIFQKNSWNVFRYQDNLEYIGYGSGRRLDKYKSSFDTEQSIVAPLYNRIGIDVASIDFSHVRLDENSRFAGYILSGLNNCLSLEANIDQSGRAFIQDVVMSLCDEGVVAVIPVDTTVNSTITDSYDILSMRTAKILQWYPEHITVRLYNQATGLLQDITLPKKMCAIIENPLYSIMNEPNSTLRRLINKINLLDLVDNQSGSGKLDLIIQLPYTVKSELRKEQANKRRGEIETQLKDSKYGIAYIDGTEQITQLNRPAENNLMAQIEYLSNLLFGQLGISEAILNGSAGELEMLNYFNRSVGPFVQAITDSFKRTFLTKTARTQRQSIMAIRDPFKLIPSSELADLADKFTRNEICSSNEFRSFIGLLPSKDPKADELRNKNLNQTPQTVPESPKTNETENNQNGSENNGNQE